MLVRQLAKREGHLVPYYTPDVSARGDWRHVPCTDPAVNDAAKPAAWRWQGAYAEDAWEDVREGYRRNKTNPNYRLSFPRSVSNFFHGPEAMDCDVLAPAKAEITLPVAIFRARVPRQPISFSILL